MDAATAAATALVRSRLPGIPWDRAFFVHVGVGVGGPLLTFDDLPGRLRTTAILVVGRDPELLLRHEARLVASISSGSSISAVTAVTAVARCASSDAAVLLAAMALCGAGGMFHPEDKGASDEDLREQREMLCQLCCFPRHPRVPAPTFARFHCPPALLAGWISSAALCGKTANRELFRRLRLCDEHDDQPWVAVAHFQGGFGNRLFQAAFAMACARPSAGRRGRAAVDYAFHGSSGTTHHSARTHVDEIFSRFPTASFVDGLGLEEDGVARIRESALDAVVPRFDPRLQDAPACMASCDQPLRLYDGFFQCPAYFEHCKDELVSVLRPEPERVRAALDDDRGGRSWAETAFLHVRLGDYVGAPMYWDPGAVSAFYVDSLRDLSASASHSHSHKMRVLVFTNGTAEQVDRHFPVVRRTIEELGMTLSFFDDDDGRGTQDELVAFYAMMRCGLGGVVPNSTFSWWAAYVGYEPGRRYYHYGRGRGLDAFPRDRGVVLWQAGPPPSASAPTTSPAPSSPVVVVTAYFRIPSKEPHAFYEPHLRRFLSTLDAEIVFFTTPDLVRELAAMRPATLRPLTFATLDSIAELEAFRRYGRGFWERMCAADPQNDDRKNRKRHTPELAALWYEKKEFVKRAMRLKGDDHGDHGDDRPFVWCDAGCVRSDAWLPTVATFGQGQQRIAALIEGGRLALQLVAPQHPIDDRAKVLFEFPDVHVGGAIIAGRRDAWLACSEHYDRALDLYVSRGMCATSDQYVWMTAAILNPGSFRLVPPRLDEIPSGIPYAEWFHFLAALSLSSARRHPIVFVMTCLKNRAKWAGMREAWLDAAGMPFVFCVGVGQDAGPSFFDEATRVLSVACDDSYDGQAAKVKLGLGAVIERFDPGFVVKVDDDVLARPREFRDLVERAAAEDPDAYAGVLARFHAPSACLDRFTRKELPVPMAHHGGAYCGGPAYVLGSRAARLVAERMVPGAMPFEDVNVGMTLASAGGIRARDVRLYADARHEFEEGRAAAWHISFRDGGQPPPEKK